MANQESLFSVRGLRILVTGGTRGIGHAIAQAFAAAGATVFLTGREAQAAQAAAATIGPDCHGHALDVGDEDAVAALAALLRERHGGIDVLVNNAGIDPHYARLDKTDSGQWRDILRINLDGVFFCCKHFGTAMVEAQRGSIINISSVAGQFGLKRQTPYCASKGGVEQLTRALALDWAEFGIRVNAIGYGFIETDLTAGMTSHPHIAPRLLARTPMGRFGKVDEVGAAAVFLAAPAASYITGHTLMVDGGWSAA